MMTLRRKRQPGFLVLAAGESRRFGRSCKLAADFTTSKSVFETTLETILSVSRKVMVVTRQHNHAVIQLADRLGVEYSLVPDSPMGIGESLRAGVVATSDWSGWIICLADMPYITAESYSAVWQRAMDLSGALGSSSLLLVAPEFEGRRGHPVFLGKQYFNDLIKCSGDIGAANILTKYRKDLVKVQVEDSGVLRDIDRPEDLPH